MHRLHVLPQKVKKCGSDGCRIFLDGGAKKGYDISRFHILVIVHTGFLRQANWNLTGHIRSISFDQPINIDAEGNIDFPVGKISIYQNDICFAIDMCMALDMRCGARKFCTAKLQFTAWPHETDPHNL